jgi:hypothetical protein
METSTQIIVIYRENKANIFDKLVLEVAQKYSGSHIFSGTKKLSVAEQTIATVKKITFKFPDKDSRGLFISELSEFDGITFEENPWLKMVGMHQDNPQLFEEVVAYIEANRQNDDLEENLSPPIEAKKENPWLKIAGKYENDPYFDQMLENISEYRHEQDAELDEYYRQMEIAENNSNSTNLVSEVSAL